MFIVLKIDKFAYLELPVVTDYVSSVTLSSNLREL